MRLLRFVVLGLVVVFVALAGAAFAFTRSDPTAASAGRPVGLRPRPHEVWRVGLAFDSLGLPAADQAGVVVTAGERDVVAVSRAGKLDWTTPLAGAAMHAPRIDGDRVFVVGDTTVAALARDTGVTEWSVATGEGDGARPNRPVVAGDTVIVTTEDGTVRGLDRATGAERWRRVLDTETPSEPAVGTTPDGPAVLVVSGLAAWWGIDPATGAVLWDGDLGLFGTSSPIVYPTGLDLVAVVASDQQLFAVDAHTGAPKWHVPADQSELFQTPALAANDSELLVPDHWGRLAAYDPQTGKRLWSVKGADTVAEFGEPVLVADRAVALPLDAHGPRIATSASSVRLKVPADGVGVADLPGPDGGLVVTTAGKPRNYVLLYRFG